MSKAGRPKRKTESNDLQYYVIANIARPLHHICDNSFILGADLDQVVNDREHVIVKHYSCVIRKELLAVVNGLKYFHSYLYGQEVTQ